ncbi:MAG: DUF393 domain-containing protein [uncultured Thiotrichaceae bacterium]|uniref:DUF393 domain-containing protein n=1 Tax=uncultured Thiotrichaceae bacterium TaxID=298394 RepID=A0A6S6U575_9GAMM|nr:MAG: DUF393 domain-containing protein [uncultured Thiotrichaceae bacterium]
MATQNNVLKNNKQLMCFYDGECPVCEFEIKTMKKLDKDEKVDFIDITKDPQVLEEAGITYQEAMDKMHVIDAEKGLQSGVSGFILLWQKLPFYRHLAVIVQKIPGSQSVLEWGYKIFAKHRHRLKRKSTN